MFLKSTSSIYNSKLELIQESLSCLFIEKHVKNIIYNKYDTIRRQLQSIFNNKIVYLF